MERNTLVVLLKSKGKLWFDIEKGGFTPSIWEASKFSPNEAAILANDINVQNPQDEGVLCATMPLALAVKKETNEDGK
jgi:hypothetical protein